MESRPSGGGRLAAYINGASACSPDEQRRGVPTTVLPSTRSRSEGLGVPTEIEVAWVGRSVQLLARERSGVPAR